MRKSKLNFNYLKFLFYLSELNAKLFRKIGLVVPKHMATQLSICKTGIAQILLSNLRACLTMAGANTYNVNSRSISVMDRSRPRAILAGNSNRRINGANTPYIYADEYEYYWHQKQTARAIRDPRSRAPPPQKSFSHPNINSKGVMLPPINRVVASRMQTDRDYNNSEDIDYLKGQLRRMEILLQSKNAKIHDLSDQLNRLRKPKR